MISYQVIRSWGNADDGYMRVRARLNNGDFLEAAEYFVVEPSEIKVVDYRHQWMDGEKKQLRRRWDNTQHHLELDNAPYHCHVGDEETVEPSHPMSIMDVLAVIEAELGTVTNATEK